MTYSSLSTYNRQPEKHFNKRDHEIDSVAIHCTSGSQNSTAKQLVDYFYNLDRSASCNYVIGGDGSIGGCVSEENRAWTTSNRACDMRSITIEVASANTAPYAVNDKALESLYNLLTDICLRYNFTLKWSYNKEERVNHLNGVNMYCHRDFVAKSCPGDYLYNREESIAAIVNARIAEAKQNTNNETEDNNMPITTNINTDNLTKLQGKSVIEENIMQKLFDDKYPDFADLVKIFYEGEEHYQIRADLAIAQAILETGHFQFTGYCRKEWNNFGGLGITDTNAAINKAVFVDHFQGAVANMQHLFAYVYTADKGLPTDFYAGWGIIDPRFHLVSRGCAPYVEWLGQKENPSGKGWATGKDYGYKILKIYADLLDLSYDYKVQEKIDEELAPTTEIEDLSLRRDTPDAIYQINPTKVYKFASPDDVTAPIGVVSRGRVTIIEEQNGYGLLKDGGWIYLGFATYIGDAE